METKFKQFSFTLPIWLLKFLKQGLLPLRKTELIHFAKFIRANLITDKNSLVEKLHLMSLSTV